MLNKRHSPLEWVEIYPQTEPIFRKYDLRVGKCILCECLFDSIETIEKDYKLDLSDLLDELHKAIKKNDNQI